MAMIGGIADSDYDFQVNPYQRTPEELAAEESTRRLQQEQIERARKELLDNPMKVDLGRKDVLFIIYFGKYYLINKVMFNDTLVLKHETRYLSSLIFDDNGVILKAKPPLNKFIQAFVNKHGSERLLKITTDLTDISSIETQQIMKAHKSSVLRFETHKAELAQFIALNK